jgi:hypothetical protein
MSDRPDTEIDEHTRLTTGAPAAIALRAEQRRNRRLRLLGGGLIAYGLVGTILFALLGLNVASPLERLGHLATSVEDQRGLALETLDRAADTLSQTAAGVTNMDNSLARVQVATGQAALISHGVATSMRDLAESMSIDVFGIQPFLGLVAGFDQSAEQLDELGNDVSDIGLALTDNRRDAGNVGRSLNQLSLTVARLAVSARSSPSVGLADGSIEALTFGLLAITAWLFVLAVGCMAAGGGLIWLARRP